MKALEDQIEYYREECDYWLDILSQYDFNAEVDGNDMRFKNALKEFHKASSMLQNCLSYKSYDKATQGFVG